MPSAMVCSQPNLPPTRVGPSRSWIRPATLRSSQMKNTAETANKGYQHNDLGDRHRDSCVIGT